MGKCFKNDRSVIDPALGGTASSAVNDLPRPPEALCCCCFMQWCGEKKCFGQSSSSISLRQSALFRKHANVPYSSTGIPGQGFIALFSITIIVFDKTFHVRNVEYIIEFEIIFIEIIITLLIY